MPASSPSVSVILPFLNAEAFLAETVESVQAQTLGDWELIFVDDGSTDASRELASTLARQDSGRFSYLTHPGRANRGPSASRNLAVSKARGDFIAFLDADDVWAPTKLEGQLRILADHPGVGFVCGAVRYWSSWNGGKDKLVPTGHAQDRPISPPEAAIMLDPIGSAPSPCPSDIMIRRQVLLESGGFDERFVALFEDQTLFFRLNLRSVGFFSSEVWMNYRLHPQSMMSTEMRAGNFHAARRIFLEWAEQQIWSGPGAPDPRLVAALSRALDTCRRPWLDRARRVRRRLSRLLPRSSSRPGQSGSRL
jgi:glycosyltransferase involved in cell wall biosynthesis